MRRHPQKTVVRLVRRTTAQGAESVLRREHNARRWIRRNEHSIGSSSRSYDPRCPVRRRGSAAAIMIPGATPRECCCHYDPLCDAAETKQTRLKYTPTCSALSEDCTGLPNTTWLLPYIYTPWSKHNICR